MLAHTHALLSILQPTLQHLTSCSHVLPFAQAPPHVPPVRRVAGPLRISSKPKT